MDDIESLFADGGLESDLLTAGPVAPSAPPRLQSLDLPERPLPREPEGGGGASGHNPSAGNGIGGAAARGGLVGADETQMGSVNYSAGTPGDGTSGMQTTGDPLTAVDDMRTYSEDFGRRFFDPLVNDTGGDASRFIIDASTSGQGKVLFTPYDVGFVPVEEQTGLVSIDYTITDGHGHTSSATIELMITPVDDPPTTSSPPAHTTYGVSNTIDLLARAHDPEGKIVTLEYVQTTSDEGGTVVDNGDGTVTYSPRENWGYLGGWDRFMYRIADEAGNKSAYLYKNIYVVSSDPNYNDPYLLDGHYVNADIVLHEGESIQTNVLTNSFNDEGSLTVIESTAYPDNPSGVDLSNISVDFSPSGLVTIQAADNFIASHAPVTVTYFYHILAPEGNPSFRYRRLPVTVLPINDPPVAIPDVVYATPGSTIHINPLPNDTDPERDSPFITNIDPGDIGTATFTPNGISLTVDPDATVDGVIQYTIKDGYGGVSTTSDSNRVAAEDRQHTAMDGYGVMTTGTVVVKVYNNAPVFNPDTYTTTVDRHLDTDPDPQKRDVLVTVTATDPDNTPANPNRDTLTYSIIGGNGEGVFDIDSATGEITLAKDAVDAIDDAYTLAVQVSDGQLTDTATVTITLQNMVGVGGDTHAVEGTTDVIRVRVYRFVSDQTKENSSLKVQFFFANGAFDPSDFQATPDRDKISNGEVTIPVGQDYVDVELIAVADPPADNNEGIDSFTIVISPSPNYKIVGKSTPTDKKKQESMKARDDVDVFVLERVTPVAAGSGELSIDINDVKQGGIGDCFTMAALVALARDDPSWLNNRLMPLGNGRYQILLFDADTGAWTEVNVDSNLVRGPNMAYLTDDVAAYGAAEIWPILWEKAYAQFLPGGYDELGQGGHTADPWTAFTGMDADSIAAADTDTGIFQQIANPLGQGKHVVLNTKVELIDQQGQPSHHTTLPSGDTIYARHAYVVKDITTDAAGQTVVKLHNPWGEQHVDIYPDELEEVTSGLEILEPLN